MTVKAQPYRHGFGNHDSNDEDPFSTVIDSNPINIDSNQPNDSSDSKTGIYICVCAGVIRNVGACACVRKLQKCCHYCHFCHS